MSPTHRADPELDDLIAEITTDCYDEDEALIGFENAFDEADCLPCPCPGAVVGEDVRVLSISATNGRRELIATCQRNGLRHEVALLDISTPPANPRPASRPPIAHRRWLGADSETT